MKSQEEINRQLKEMKPYLHQKFSVNKIGYFGSYARNAHTENSDLDILVELGKPLGWEFFDLQEYLENTLKLKVDLTTVNGLKEQLKEVILKSTKYV
jgi:predicted nucleotidyltransferase